MQRQTNKTLVYAITGAIKYSFIFRFRECLNTIGKRCNKKKSKKKYVEAIHDHDRCKVF